MNGQPANKRSFGSIRETSNHRFQARYTAPDHQLVAIKGTFRTKREAERALTRIEIQLEDRNWKDPRKPRPTVAEFIPDFMASRRGKNGGDLKPRTIQLYQSQLQRYILPAFGHIKVDQIDVGMVNRWHSQLPGGPTLHRQLYALLKSICLQAVEQEIIARSPCRLKGAGQNHYNARPYISPEDIDSIIANLHGDVRMLAELAYDTHLRIGEVLALTWLDIDLSEQRLFVRHSVSEVANEQVVVTPKNGFERTVFFEFDIADDILKHRGRRLSKGTDRLFRRSDGTPLRHFHVHSAWNQARRQAGLEHVRFHDMRHTGLTQASLGGLSVADVMARGGHRSIQSALNYQHRADEQARANSQRLARNKADRRRYGTAMTSREELHGESRQESGVA